MNESQTKHGFIDPAFPSPTSTSSGQLSSGTSIGVSNHSRVVAGALL